MKPDSLPDGIITRFRTLSLERVARVESVWSLLVQGEEDAEAVRAVSHDLHTLKGDARIVGFDEVHALSHKLEELLGVAAQSNYQVSEDFDLVVTMATQFLGMLLRKKGGGASGIDLEGFIQQVDDVLRETRVLRRSKPTGPRVNRPSKSGELASDRLSEPVRQRLATAATETFIEYLNARNPSSRTRLRRVWQVLSEELAGLHTVALAPLLERHVAAASQLALDLGKHVDLHLAIDDIRLESRVGEAVDIAVLHLIRNAIDHGIELPNVRTAAGKPAQGAIAIRAAEANGRIEMVIEDDGAGIDLQRVRAKATERGLLDANRVVGEKELHDVLFHSGFTTRDDVSDVSGRGVGLDAVKSALQKAGATVRITPQEGRGAAFSLSLPAPLRQMRVFQFYAPGKALSLAISARWTPSVEEGHDENALDPIVAIQLLGGSRQTLSGMGAPPRELVMRLRWGFLEIALRTASEPQLVTAERVCPTAENYPLEVLVIDGVEALLLRPEHIAGMIKRSSEP